MAWDVDGYDNFVTALEKHKADQVSGTLSSSSTTSTTYVQVASWSPTTPPVSTDYLLICQITTYCDTGAKQAYHKFTADLGGAGEADLYELSSYQGTGGQVWRPRTFCAKVTIPNSGTTTFRAYVKATSPATVYYYSPSVVFILLPYYTFNNPDEYATTTAEVSDNVTAFQFPSSGGQLSYSPANTTDLHFILAQANVVGGTTTRKGKHRFTIHVGATASGVPSYSAPSSSLTVTSATFGQEHVGGEVKFATSGNVYPISAVSDSTHCTLTGDASGETSGDTLTVKQIGPSTITIHGASTPNQNMWPYLVAYIQSFASTSTRTMGFEMCKSATGVGVIAINQQCIFCGVIPEGRILAARGVIGARGRIVTAAYPR